MPTYRLDPKAAPHVLADGQTVLPGQTFEVEDPNLVTKFANKFLLADGERADVREGHIRPDAEHVVEADGTRISTAGPDLSPSTKRPDVNTAGPTTMNLANPDDALAVEASGRPSAPLATVGKAAEAQAEESEGLEDVSGDFPTAKEAGLTVWKDKRGWHVYDGNDEVSEKALLKKDVEGFIKDFNS